MYSFLLLNSLVSPNQFGFKPMSSCINQGLSITHEISPLFDEGFKARSVFRAISKAFNKVWQQGLTFKLSHNGITC